MVPLTMASMLCLLMVSILKSPYVTPEKETKNILILMFVPCALVTYGLGQIGTPIEKAHALSNSGGSQSNVTKGVFFCQVPPSLQS